AAGAGDEVGGVDKEVAGALGGAERGVEQRHRADLAAEDWRLVDRAVVETAADLRVRAHALRGAVNRHFGLLGAYDELDPQRRGFTRTQPDVVASLAAEAL